jgi:hypothetical protein
VQPHIDGTRFGSITIDGTRFEHDVVIWPDGTVTKRKKKLSKRVYGSSHTISLAEAEYVYEHAGAATLLIIGSGQNGMVHLSGEAARYLAHRGCRTLLAPTPQALEDWNRAAGNVAGLFHVTC